MSQVGVGMPSSLPYSAIFAVEDVDLGLTLMEQSVLAHGGIVVADVGDDVGMVVCDEIVGVHGNTLCGCNGAGLTDDAVEQLLAPRISLDLTDLQTQNPRRRC